MAPLVSKTKSLPSSAESSDDLLVTRIGASRDISLHLLSNKHTKEFVLMYSYNAIL
jgi:hypothetical protein